MPGTPDHPRTCGHCDRFGLDPADRLTPHGYGRCAHEPAWQYRARGAQCAFDPSRFVNGAHS